MVLGDVVWRAEPSLVESVPVEPPHPSSHLCVAVTGQLPPDTHSCLCLDGLSASSFVRKQIPVTDLPLSVGERLWSE